MEPLKIDETGRVVLPQLEEIPSKDKEHAAGAYIMMFASQYLPLPFINLIASFIYYVFCRKRARFVAFHAYQSLISQIPTSIMLWAVLAWVIVGLVMAGPDNFGDVFNVGFWIVLSAAAIWGIAYVVFSLIAFVAAGKGKMYYLPIFGKIAFERYFGKNAVVYAESQEKPHINKPPGM